MIIACSFCGSQSDKPSGAVNRARRIGAPLYCDRKCAGLAKRQEPKSEAQRKAEKAAYDREYRDRNREALRAKKAAFYQRTRDPVKEAIARKRRMPKHVEYCRRPEYRVKKAEYDRQYRAKEFGPFSEAYQLTIALNREIKSRSSNYEIRQANHTGNKTQDRDRQAQGPKRDRSRRPSAAVG